MRPAKDVENLIKRVHLKASTQMHERIVNDALEGQGKSRKTKTAQFETNIWKIILRSPITKLAVAPVIVLAVLIGISTFNGTSAWAEVIKALGEVENVYIVSTMTMPDGTKVQSKRWLRKPHCLREEEPSRIVIDNGKERLTINKEKKRAQFEDSWAGYRPISQDYIFEEIEIFRGQKVKGVTVTKLEEKSNDSIIVFHLDYSSPYSQLTFQGKAWVDAHEMLPKRIEAQLTSKPEAGDPQSGEMVFDYAPISNDVFEPVVPEGFTELPRKRRGVMSGRVLDEHEQPVANAIVFVTDRAGQFSEQTITDESGHFTFKLSPEGVGAPLWLPVLLRAFVDGVPDKIAWSIIKDPASKDEPGGQIPYDVTDIDNDGCILKSANGITLRMEPAGTIAGQVTDADGAPISDAKVKLLRCDLADKHGNAGLFGIDVHKWSGPDELGIVRTDENGWYELINLPQLWKRTKVFIHAEAEGFAGDTISFYTKGPIEYEELDLQLYRAGITVSGVLVDNYGELLREREVYARIHGKDYRACRTKTDKKGRFRLAGCPITEHLQIKGELSHNHWPPHEKERYMSYRYHPDVTVGIDYEKGKTEYEVELVAERPEIVIEVELKNTAGEPLPYFPVQVRGAPGSISSQWAAAKKLEQRTDKNGYCKLTEVPKVEDLGLVMSGSRDGVWNDTLSREEAKKISKEYRKYKWTKVPVELVPGRKEYKIEVTILTNEEYEQKK
jgi:protocatechuate 3,4-dioxygenase beta subunit